MVPYKRTCHNNTHEQYESLISPSKKVMTKVSFSRVGHKVQGQEVINSGTVKYFLFARTLFSRKFSRPVTRENKVHANISYLSTIVQEMNNHENKVSWINPKSWARENKVTRKISVLQYHAKGLDTSNTHMQCESRLSSSKKISRCVCETRMPPAATKSKKLFLASRSKSRSQGHWPWCHLKGCH